MARLETSVRDMDVVERLQMERMYVLVELVIKKSILFSLVLVVTPLMLHSSFGLLRKLG